LSNEGLVS